VRALAVNTDTFILIVVNDNHWNDQNFHYTPVSNATVTATLPAWMQTPAPTAFQVSAGGIGDVATQINGSQFQLNLGTLDVTRMIVVTKNAQLRSAIQQRYDLDVRPGVCNFAPEVCSQEIPPSITQHPQPSTICAGAAAQFSVGASGSGSLSYQWQKNQSNLSNGGHYAGVTTSTLMIASADHDDAASYRCVVSNAHGSATSNAAALTVLACNPNCLQNLGFEGGFTNGIGAGWTKFIKAGTEGDDLSFFDETTETHSGAHSQGIYSHDSGHDGGVYQRFAATPGQAYTLKTWFKVYSPEGTGIAEGLLGLDATGGTDPNSGNVIWVSQPYEFWHPKIWTVTAQANYITVYLRGRSTKDASKNKTAYVWIDDVQMAPAAPADDTPQAVGTNGIRWRWIDSPSETAYRVRDGAGTDKSGLLPADTTQWLETTSLAPNTQYTRHITALNDCGESDPSSGQSAITLSVEPQAGIVTPSTTHPDVAQDVIWTAIGGFGPGTLAYYRYVWDQNPAHDWTELEPQWSSGVLTTSPTAPGAWYLHVQGYNAADVANGTYDYEVVAGTVVSADFDFDGDVDLTDFAHLQNCFDPAGGPVLDPDCADANLDNDEDGDINQADVIVFLNCITGPGIPASSGCTN
jgi:hypothetical protein